VIRFDATRRAVVVVAAALCAQLASAAPQVRYHVVALDPGHASDRNALSAGINRKGLVAGCVGGGTSKQATLFRRGKSSTALGTLGGRWSSATSVNDAGVVAGASENASGQSHAFVWRDGVMTDLGQLPISGAAARSSATAINALGQMAGFSAIDATHTHAVLFDGGTIVDLGAPAGTVTSYARGVNDLAHVVGIGEDASWGLHAFVWRDGVMTALGGLGDGTGLSTADAINAGDEIAGSATLGATGPLHAVVWRNDVIEDLGTLTGAPDEYSAAFALNDHGVVVGLAHRTGTFDEVAFVHNGKRMVDLNTLLDAESAGWMLASARAINAKGEITGFGAYDGVIQRFLATPVK